MAPAATAELRTAYGLVGEDPAGDAKNPVVTGQDIPESAVVVTFGRGKYDVLGLEIADEPDALVVKMNMGASYIGTSSMVYLTFFTIHESTYFVCWNINSAGLTTNYQDIGENLDLSCSRFNSLGTRVGPSTRANGVETATDPNGIVYVQWAVPRGEIDDARVGTLLTAVRAETWVRGVSTCCPPSTAPQSQYVWNIADRAPDDGEWQFQSGPATPSIAVDLTLEPKNATVGPGSNATSTIRAVLNGTGPWSFNLTASNAPDGWSVAFEPANGSLETEGVAESSLTVSVPSDATNGAYNLTIELAGDANISARANFTLIVDERLRSPETVSTGAVGAMTATATTAANETAAAQGTGDESVPGLGVIFGVLAVTAVAFFARRRR